VKPWEHKCLTDRQRNLAGLANATAWIRFLEKIFAGDDSAEIRALLAKTATLGIDPVETRGLPELVELMEAVTEYRTLYKKLYGTRRGNGPTEKSKPGRPSIWRGAMGCYFFHCVQKARKEKRRSIAAAIRWVVKNDPYLKDLSRFKPAALQARYQEAADEWSWTLKGDEHNAMGAALALSSKRLRAAYKAWKSFHLREHGLSVRQSDFP
jgi:hypothetical protein